MKYKIQLAEIVMYRMTHCDELSLSNKNINSKVEKLSGNLKIQIVETRS